MAGADTRTPASKNAFLANKTLNETIADIVNYSMGALIAAPATSVVTATTNRLPRTTLMLPSAVYPIDTQLRIVFDGQPAADSSKYIEGRISISGDGSYALANVTASGISLSGLTQGGIPGTKSQTGITYRITANDNINPSQVRQYYKQPPTSGRILTDWTPDSEFGSITIAEEGFAEEGYVSGGANPGFQDSSYRKNSVIVYLILDGSPSLSAGQTVEQIRSKARDVINQLYNAVSNPTQKAISSASANQDAQFPQQIPVVSQPVAPLNVQPYEFPQQMPAPPVPLTQNTSEYAQFVDAWISGPYNGGYWVQVGAFQNSENIKRVTDALQSRNYRVDTGLTVVENGTFLRRVLVGGPYSRTAAENELRIIRETILPF
jgi:hypothetical protein